MFVGGLDHAALKYLTYTKLSRIQDGFLVEHLNNKTEVKTFFINIF